jgi:F420-non-reducing hydrogenase small subunit
MGRPKAAFYWASSCGGCDIAILAIGEKILDVAAAVDIVFWPAAMDFKYEDVEGMPEQSIDVCLFNGAIRNTEDEHVAKMLRSKSKIMIAYGSCAYEGCIPGLANLFTMESILIRRSYPRPRSRCLRGNWNCPDFTVRSERSIRSSM